MENTEKTVITYNMEYLQSVEFTPKKISERFFYKPFKKNRIFCNQQEGFYDYNQRIFYTREFLELLFSKDFFDAKYIIIENDVYIQPSVTMIFVSGDILITNFHNEDEAVVFYKNYKDLIQNKKEFELN